MLWAKVSTAVSYVVGPILDSTGAEYASAVIGDLSISKNGGTLTALASAATLTYVANGQYTLALTTGNTDTLGTIRILCNKSTYQLPTLELMVLPATVYDALVTNATTAAGGLGDVQRVAGTTQTARDLGLALPAVAPNTNGGLPILSSSGTTLGYTVSTVTTLTNLPAITAGWLTTTGIADNAITAAKIADGAIDAATFAAGAITSTVAPNLDAAVSSRMATYTQPTGFLAATFPTTVASTTNITAATGITVATVSDKTGYSLTQAFPANFSALAISVAGLASADLKAIATAPVAVDTGTAGTVSFVSGAYVATTGTTVNANIVAIDGENVRSDGDGRLWVLDDAGNPIPGAVRDVSNAAPPAGSFGESARNADAKAADIQATLAAGVIVTTNNDKTGYTLTVTPPTAAAIATAVWTDATGSDFATASTPGKILVGQLGGAFTTTTSSVFSTAAMANVVATADTAAIAEAVADVLGETLPPDVAQAVGSLTVPGSFPGGTMGGNVGRIGSGEIVTTAVAGQGGRYTVRAGLDYFLADGRQLPWTDTEAGWQDLTGATVHFRCKASSGAFTKAAVCTNPGASLQHVYVELSAAESATLRTGEYLLVATLGDGHDVDLAVGTLVVN